MASLAPLSFHEQRFQGPETQRSTPSLAADRPVEFFEELVSVNRDSLTTTLPVPELFVCELGRPVSRDFLTTLMAIKLGSRTQ